MGIREIAKQANVSIATVSRVLNTPDLVTEETRNKVLEIAESLNYKKYEPSVMKTNGMNEIGVIMPDIKNTFFARILEGIINQANEYDLPSTLFLTKDNFEEEKKAVDILINKQVKGVILIRTINKSKEANKIIQKLSKYHIPCILVDRDVPNSDNSGVFLSNANAVYDSINLLLNDNYTKIAFITGPSDNSNSSQRIEGFKKAYANHHLEIDESNIYSGEFNVHSGFNITKKILDKKNIPDAIFSCSNQITIGCIKAINEKGLVLGKDIKLFSFIKLNAANVNNFNISYIEHQAEHMGVRSVVILKNKLVGAKGLIREVLDYTIHY